MTTTEPESEPKPAKNVVSFSKIPRTLINRRWWWTTILVILGMAVMARLGFWQLDRLAQKQANNARLVEQYNSSPINLNTDQLPAELAEIKDRPAIVSGRFDFDQQLLLTQQSWGGFPGVHIITPLLIHDSDQVVLVDRGWIPVDEAGSGSLEQFDELGAQAVDGSLQLSQTLSGGRETVTEGWQREWYRVDIQAIQRQLPYDVLPVYLMQLPDGDEQSPPLRAEQELILSEGAHLAYAIQWFVFALLLGGGYIYFVTTRDHREVTDGPV